MTLYILFVINNINYDLKFFVMKDKNEDEFTAGGNKKSSINYEIGSDKKSISDSRLSRDDLLGSIVVDEDSGAELGYLPNSNLS